jgi:DNA-binding PadR family transcriptional regulator
VYIEIIILSVLRHGPIHGYELKQRVRTVTLNELSNNSLYPTLRRFEQSGIATKSVEMHDGRPPRNVYEITAQGRGRFREMISTLPAELASNDEEFLVRVGFFAEIATADRTAILRARDAVLAQRLAGLHSVNAMPSRTADRYWRDVTTARYIATIESERAWIGELMTQAN